MKNISLKLLTLSLLSLPLCADAEDPAPLDTKKPLIHYHNRMVVFLPWHQVYERIKPNAFYAGVEAWIAGADVVCSHNKGPHSLSDEHRTTAIGEAEIRMGYNFLYNGRDHLTPFVGGGVLKDISERHTHTYILYDNSSWEKKETVHFSCIGYGTVGFLYDHEFNSVFNLGFNLKGIVGGDTGSDKVKWGNTIFGVDTALPLTFRCGNKRHWDIRLEPFFLYLHGSDVARGYVGGRSTVGYRF